MRLILLSLVVLLSGCGRAEMQIRAENKSGHRLENVSISGAGKNFGFGVLANGGEKGFMNAQQVFGRKIPSEMTMNFMVKEGKSHTVKVVFDHTTAGKNLRITVDSNLKATGTFE